MGRLAGIFESLQLPLLGWQSDFRAVSGQIEPFCLSDREAIRQEGGAGAGFGRPEDGQARFEFRLWGWFCDGRLQDFRVRKVAVEPITAFRRQRALMWAVELIFAVAR
jgi:hypothetical protein